MSALQVFKSNPLLTQRLTTFAMLAVFTVLAFMPDLAFAAGTASGANDVGSGAYTFKPDYKVVTTAFAGVAVGMGTIGAARLGLQAVKRGWIMVRQLI